MLHAGLDLSRRRLDVCLLDEHGGLAGELAVPPDVDGLHGLVRRLHGHRVRAVIESMNGARFVHDTLEEHGWEVLVADAQEAELRSAWRSGGSRKDLEGAHLSTDALLEVPGEQRVGMHHAASLGDPG